MDDLIEMIQKLVLVLGAVFMLMALPFFLVKVAQVCGSDEGLWQQCPHCGFCPDSPTMRMTSDQ